LNRAPDIDDAAYRHKDCADMPG